MIIVLILDKNEILPAHVIPTGVYPGIVNPLPTLSPTDPIKKSETIINTFFYLEFYLSFFVNQYQF